MQVACGGRGQGVAVPSGGWAVSSAIVVVAFGGDGAGGPMTGGGSSGASPGPASLCREGAERAPEPW